MKIDLRPIKHEIGAHIPFSFNISIVDREPTVPSDVKVTGDIKNRAGYLILNMTMEAEIVTVCDRCLDSIARMHTVEFEAVLADSIEGEEDDGIIVCENDEFVPDELAASTFILEMPTKNLCREDCKGLCPKCGTNLNESDCSCTKKEIDPRLSKLLELLDE
ncbi:MAG: DUF177 domain-containing protein [Clostridia bacterium]|nr:DUF177 domain-containing protein [Clostridia bacterium]